MLILWLHRAGMAVRQTQTERQRCAAGLVTAVLLKLLCMRTAPCCFHDCSLGQAAHRKAMWRFVAVHGHMRRQLSRDGSSCRASPARPVREGTQQAMQCSCE